VVTRAAYAAWWEAYELMGAAATVRAAARPFDHTDGNEFDRLGYAEPDPDEEYSDMSCTECARLIAPGDACVCGAA
jgi:hypothetical protein